MLETAFAAALGGLVVAFFAVVVLAFARDAGVLPARAPKPRRWRFRADGRPVTVEVSEGQVRVLIGQWNTVLAEGARSAERWEWTSDPSTVPVDGPPVELPALRVRVEGAGPTLRCQAWVDGKRVLHADAPLAEASRDPRMDALQTLLNDLEEAPATAALASDLRQSLSDALQSLDRAQHVAQAHAVLGGEDADGDALVQTWQSAVDRLVEMVREVHLLSQVPDAADAALDPLEDARQRLRAEREVNARLQQAKHRAR